MPKASKVYHCSIPKDTCAPFVWECPNSIDFDEMLVSWNAQRPPLGALYQIYISVKLDTWSPWLLYATWGSDTQGGNNETDEARNVVVNQDTIEITQGKIANGFRIRIDGKNIGILENFYALHVCVSHINNMAIPQENKEFHTLELQVPRLSQMTLPHPLNKNMCSGTSTASVISYLQNNNLIDPIHFAINAKDEHCQIFGNWVLAVAQAAQTLSPKWHCWVEKMDGFHAIYRQLQKNVPVVVSVRSPLPGSAQSYNQGHLIVVRGYDAERKKVMCMDPAFESNEKTYVNYPLEDFLLAWSRRGYVGYFFELQNST